MAEVLNRLRLSLSQSDQPFILLGDAGLRNPLELISYTVLPSETPVGTSFREVSGFGTSRTVGPGIPVGALAVVFLILLVPSMLAMRSGIQFLLASRSKRYQILATIGLPERRLASLFASECAIVVVVGLSLGFAGFQATQGWLGSSGLLPAVWWPTSGSGNAPWFVFVSLLAALWTWVIASRLLLRGVEFTPVQRSGLGGSVARVASSLAVLTTCFLAAILIQGLALRPSGRQPEALTIGIFFAIALGGGAICVTLPHWGKEMARWAAGRSRSPLVRWGLHRAAYSAAAGARFVLALVILSLVSGVAAGFITGVGRWGEGYQTSRTVEVDSVGKD